MPAPRSGADAPAAEAPAAEAAAPAAPASGPRVLKKYPNRRLYDTRSSAYITLADVKALVLELEDFEVRDAKSGEDLTRSILLQIILEEESGGVPMFSAQMLAQMIRFYGHSMQGLMGRYLENSLQAFVDLQKRFAAASLVQGEAQAFAPEVWTQLMTGQANPMQGMMNAYMEQSQQLVKQLQEQMVRNSGPLFPAAQPKPPTSES